MKHFFMKSLAGLGLAAAFAGSAQAGIVEVSANITADTRFTRDNVYVLTQIVYVLPPARLTIEPGTLIRGANDSQTGGTNNPGTLVVSRGAKVIGNGTADDPIIFTSTDDTLVPGGANTRPTTVLGTGYTPLDYTPGGATGTNAFFHTKLTGGLILCGRTPLGFDGDADANFLQWNGTVHSVDTLVEPTANNDGLDGKTASQGNGVGFAVPEGLSLTTVTLGAAFDPDGAGSIPASTSFIAGGYGGVLENDDSGVIRFWSIRYGGFNISANNELNGLTMCGVGRGTVIEFQEVAQNVDDNFEWFGGYVNAKYLFGLFGGDDGIDGDQGYSGSIQHAFVINDNENYAGVGRPGYTPNNTASGRLTSGSTATVSDKLVEWDGPEPNGEGVTPETIAHVFNFTLIGNRGAVGAGAVASDDGFNCKAGDSSQFFRGMVEDVFDTFWSPSDATGVHTKLTTSDVRDTLYFNVGAAGATSGTAENLATAAAATQLRGKLHTTKNGLDPRLVVNTAGADARDLSFAAIPSRSGVTDFFTPTLFHGAMRDNNMLFGWTWAHAVEIIVADNVLRPVVTLGLSGSNPTISFPVEAAGGVAGDNVVYVVERSSDGVAWAPVGYVFDGSTTDAPTLRLADSNAGALAVTVTDTATTFSGAAMHYRVIPQ